MPYEISFKTVHYDFGRKIGKIRYHYFQNWDFQKKLTVRSAQFSKLSFRIFFRKFFSNCFFFRKILKHSLFLVSIFFNSLNHYYLRAPVKNKSLKLLPSSVTHTNSSLFFDRIYQNWQLSGRHRCFFVEFFSPSFLWRFGKMP